MTTSFALLILSAAACAWLVLRGIKDHGQAMVARHGLLDEAGALLAEAECTIGPDQYPVVRGRIADGRRVKIELVADSMITRRLPQLWLRLTLYDAAPDRPRIGALARPTGGEYYSLVHDMPQWMEPPKTGTSMLMRGDGSATAWQVDQVLRHFGALFADPIVKEAVISPNGVRIMLQAAQGERAAHLFLRQSRFATTAVPGEDIRKAIAMTDALAAVLSMPEPAQVRATEAA
jgi:hypothetical protein